MPARGHRLDSLKARRLLAGLSVGDLARRSNTSDWIIHQLENGGSCDPHITERLLDALGPVVTVTSSSIANPTNILTATAHTFVSTDTVTIVGHTGSTPAVDGERVATFVNATNFTVPINVSTGGTGGTARLSATALGIARL